MYVNYVIFYATAKEMRDLGTQYFLIFNAIDCSSKYAAIGFNESLRAEFLSNGYDDIHVTTVCPYYMTTKMFRGVQT